MQLSFAPLVKQVSPAVVNIYTSRTVTKRVRHPFLDDPFFGQMFRNHAFGGQMRKQIENSLGSGVIVAEDGLIVTNHHVIEGADEVRVVLADRREFRADIVAMEERNDPSEQQIPLG